MFDQKNDRCHMLVGQSEYAYFFFGNESKRLNMEGLEQMRCVVNYWAITLAYFVLAFTGIFASLYISTLAAKVSGNDLIFGFLFPIIGGAIIYLVVRLTDGMAMKFSSMLVLFKDRKIIIKNREYDLVNDIYDVKEMPFFRQKVVIYGMRSDNGKAIPWLHRLTFFSEAQAHFFVRYVEYLHAEEMIKKLDIKQQKKENNAHHI